MDGYMYNLDPYRQPSAGYYAPRYHGLERRSSYGLPSADSLPSYARVPLDPYAGYGVPASYQPEVVPSSRYALAPSRVFRSRPHPKTNAPPQNLGPKKKLFKQTQKVRFLEEKERPPKKDTQRNPSQTAKRNDKTNAKVVPVSQAASLAKETQELHDLFRTGVDTNTAKGEGNDASKKRKADTQMQEPAPTKESESAKKQKGKKKKKAAKEKRAKERRAKAKVEKAKAKVEKAEPVLPSKEEFKAVQAALEMQRGLCKSVSQFLGIPEIKEAADTDVKVEDAEKDNKEVEKPSKPEEPQLTPEQEKEVEVKSFKFFSSFFEEHPELRNLYIEKCNSGMFECLVCHSIDSAKSKKFWNLVSLVMHSKMRKQLRFEHSGYGRAVSAVLGWDYKKTPKVPLGARPPKVPGGARPATFTQKPSDQEKEETKQEAENKSLDEDQKEVEANGAENQQEESILEDSSDDTKEE